MKPVSAAPAALLLVALITPGCREEDAPRDFHLESSPPGELPEVPPERRVHTAPPPFSEGIFPCSECHASSPEELEKGEKVEPDPTRRELTMMHEDIVLQHDEAHRWCLDCHDLWNRDKLHLASGALVDFTESYRLCGQCHGDRYRDWRAGVHGQRKGEWRWDGKKEYKLCVHCHNSHSPRYKPIEPMPAPIPPGATQ